MNTEFKEGKLLSHGHLGGGGWGVGGGGESLHFGHTLRKLLVRK